MFPVRFCFIIQNHQTVRQREREKSSPHTHAQYNRCCLVTAHCLLPSTITATTMSRKIDKNQQILKTLLREPSNNQCADCKSATHPRWASWNLGIFICIRCSGIHRSLGTHISRVKSVDLDTWTDEQVKSMVLWGNAKANQYWEEALPQGYIPDGGKIENFIRTKYEMKKWTKGPVPDPQSLSGVAQKPEPQQLHTSSHHAQQQQQQQQQQPRRPGLNTSFSSSQLLDLEFGSPIAAPAPQHSKSQPQTRLNTPSIQTQQPQLHKQQQQQQQQQQQHQQQQQRTNNMATNTRPDLKKSILSLYSVPIATTSAPSFMNSSNTVNSSFSSLSSNHSTHTQNSSLSGLNFGNGVRVQPQVQQRQQQWGVQNEWATDTPIGSTATASTTRGNGLDDDLFKNVWN